MPWTGHVARMGQMRNSYRNFVRNPKGKRPPERLNHWWEDIRTDYRETEWKGAEWMHLAQEKEQ